MKVNILDAHDRWIQYNKQSDYISKGCIDCINNRPKEFENHPFYIFAHARTHENGVTKRLLWQPRLSKPKSQTNSMLFKAYPPSDKIKVIWMIPDRNMWSTYSKNNLTESQIICDSIQLFQFNRETLEAKESDDLLDYQIKDIYDQMSLNSEYKKSNLIFEGIEDVKI